jgi:hypothetical protein
LARFTFVHAHLFTEEGAQPESLTAEEVAGLPGRNASPEEAQP